MRPRLQQRRRGPALTSDKTRATHPNLENGVEPDLTRRQQRDLRSVGRITGGGGFRKKKRVSNNPSSILIVRIVREKKTKFNV